MSKVLITGANGFIGSHVARVFCENRIDTVCLVRTDSKLSNIEGLPIELRYGDIRNLENLKEAFKGIGFVIHIAAYARDWGNYDEFFKTNVEGTINVLDACVENRIRDIIITSSVSVYGEEDNSAVKSEESPHNSHYRYFADGIFPSAMNFYRDTKAIAKEKAIRFAKDKGINLTVLEPAWVYGEREFNTGFYEYLKTVKSGLPILPGSKRNKFHAVYAGDLALAYLSAYQKKVEGIESFIIGAKKADLMNNIYSIFCEAAGLRKPADIPKFLVYPAAFVLELLSTLLKRQDPPLLTRGRVNMFYDNIEYSTEKAEKVLGFSCKYSLEEGISRTVKWYQERNLL